MQQIKDTAGLGFLLWLIGYFTSLALFFSPFAGIMGWILIAVFTPVTVAITWWWFTGRDLSLPYYAGVGIAWTAIAVVSRLSFYRPAFPGNLLRSRRVRVLCPDLPCPGGSGAFFKTP